MRLLNFEKDALNLTKDGMVASGLVLLDTLGNQNPVIGNQPHRDGIQAYGSSTQYYHGQFALAVLSNVTIERCMILAWSKLQAIFGSDGLFDNLRIISNTLYTEGDHWISFNGLRSGTIKGNINARNGAYAPIYLGPARIGGKSENDPHPNVWVSSFLKTADNYEPVEKIVLDDSFEHVKDVRTLKERSGEIYLDNFDRERFNSFVPKVQYTDFARRCIAFKEIAFDCGDVCKV